jgi:hypothetical protein
MWSRVLAVRYGVERGRPRDGGRRGSAWCREIVRIQDGVRGIGGGRFRECLRKRWGMSHTLFSGMIPG